MIDVDKGMVLSENMPTVGMGVAEDTVVEDEGTE